MLLAMSMVAMVVVLMAFAVYAVISAALYSDIDNQLQSRAQLLIASGSLAADPAQGHRGHGVFGRQRDAGEPGPLDLHRQPAGPDAAGRLGGEGRHPRRLVHVAAHRRRSADPGHPPAQRQFAADLQESARRPKR